MKTKRKNFRKCFFFLMFEKFEKKSTTKIKNKENKENDFFFIHVWKL